MHRVPPYHDDAHPSRRRESAMYQPPAPKRAPKHDPAGAGRTGVHTTDRSLIEEASHADTSIPARRSTGNQSVAPLRHQHDRRSSRLPTSRSAPATVADAPSTSAAAASIPADAASRSVESAAGSDYTIRTHRHFDAVPEQVWNDLHDRAEDRSVFQEYGWVRAWWHTCRPRSATLQLLVAESAGQVVGIAPLFTDDEPHGRGRRLRFLGGFHNDYQYFLVDRAHPQLHSRLAEHCRSALEFDTFILNEVPAGSTLGQWLRSNGRRLVPAGHMPCPMLQLDTADPLGCYTDKKSVRRKLNKLRRLGTVEVTHIEQRGLIAQYLPELWTQHIRRWHNTAHPSIFLDKRYRRFYSQLVTRLRHGIPVFTRVTLDGRSIACHLGFRSGDDLLWYKPAFDPDYAEYSPGEYMVTELIRHAHSRRCRALDFTRGDEAFKARFTNALNWNDSYRMYPSLPRFLRKRADASLRAAYRSLRDRWRDGA